MGDAQAEPVATHQEALTMSRELKIGDEVFQVIGPLVITYRVISVNDDGTCTTIVASIRNTHDEQPADERLTPRGYELN